MKAGYWRGTTCIYFMFFLNAGVTRGIEIESLRVGCFAESPLSNREFNISAGNYNSADLQPYDCVSTCGSLGYHYAALQEGSFCFCGNSYGAHRRSFNCTMPCAGNPALTCGGLQAYAVYNASGYATDFVLNVQQQSQDLKLFADTNISASFGNQKGSPAPSKYNIGDGNGASPIITSALRFRVTRWGLIRFSAESNATSSPRKADRNLHINSPIAGARISCCALVSTTECCMCSVDVIQGTDAQASWQFQDGPLTNLSLPNPSYVSAGPAVPQWGLAPPQHNSTAGVFLVTSSRFVSEASLLALEMYGHTAGKVKIFLARPVCQNSDIYCASNMSCLSVGSSCMSVTPFQCSPGQTLCASQTRCHETSDVNCSALGASPPKIENVDYKITQVFTFDVNEGYNLHVLTTNQTVQVNPGDTLGWVSDGGSIASIQGEGRTLQYSGLSAADISPKLNISRSESFAENVSTFRLRGIAAKSVTFIVAANYSLPGVHTLQVRLSNRLTASFPLAPQHFTVQQAVTNIQPLYPTGFEFFGTQVNHVLQLFVNVSVGSNLTITWKLALAVLQVNEYRQDFPSPFFQDSLNHSFSAEGEYIFFVQASNNVSSVNTTLIVKVQQNISELQLSLTTPGSLVYKGAPTKFNASVAAGNDTKFAWQFGNGARTAFTSNNSITHRFSQTGANNVTVTASNLASQVQATLVVKVLESITMTAPTTTIATSLVNFTCNLTGPFSNNEYFYWDYGDGSTDEGAGKAHVRHGYAKGGTYRVECRIRNEILLNSSVEIVVLEVVTGLRLKNISGVELNETQTFTAITATGNQLHYVWYIHGESTIFLSVCTNDTIEFRFNETGIHSVNVNVSNSVSSEYASITFPVQVSVSGLGISANPNPAPSNTTINFKVTKGTGTNVTYRLDFGDGFVARMLGETYQFNRTFQAGRWQIILTGENSVSHVIIFRNLTVQDVIKTPTLSVESVREFDGLSMVAAGYNASLTSFRANVSEGTLVYFTWYFEKSHESVRQGTRLPSGATTSLTHHKFAIEATYNVSVRAWNSISNSSAWILVRAQELIEGFEVQADDGIEPGATLTLTLVKTSGGNVTYSVDFGDGQSLTTRKVTFDKVYARVGVYTMTVVAQNQINSATIIKLIYVQFRIRGLGFTKPLAPVALGNSSLISWSVTNGTNITYIIDFGDNQATEAINSSLVGSEISLEHTFSSSGRYTVNIKAYNRIKQVTSISDIVVVEEPIRSLLLYAQPGNVTLYDDVTIHVVIAQGENVLYRYDFGDETDHVESVNSVLQHKYKRVGHFYPTVKAWNNISTATAHANTSITVAAPSNSLKIRGLTLSCEPTAMGNVSQVKVQYDDGYLFQCEIQFGDEQSEEHGDSVLYKPIAHRYTTVGTFEVTANCSNNLGNEQAGIIAHVDNSITGLKFTRDEKDINVGFGDSLKVNWTWTTGTNINFSVSLSSHASLLYTVERLVASVVIGKDTLHQPGSYILTVKAANPITPTQIITTRINVWERITGLTLTINPNSRSRFSAWAYATINTGSQVNLRWQYGDGNETTRLPKDNQGYAFHTTYVYSKAGRFTAQVIAWNNISKQNASQAVRVFNPVEAFTLLTPKVATWPSRTILLTFTRNASTPPPTDATYIFHYGNSQSSTPLTLVPGKDLQVSHNYTYPHPGCYRVKLSIKNIVSHLTLFTNVEINKNISELNLTASNSEYSAHPGTPGGGQAGNVFPVEYSVSFAVSHDEGTCVDYIWTFGDFSANTSEAVTSHVYPLPGAYAVTVKASNALGARIATKEVILQRAVLGLFLATSSPSRPGENVSFVVFCAQCGSDSTFLLIMGDGTTQKLRRPNRKYQSQDQNLLGQNFNLPFDPSGYNITVYRHTYSAGLYKAQVQANNDASFQVANATVVVSDAICSLPRVQVLGGAKCFSSAPNFIHGREFTLTSRVNTDCADYDATFAWTLYTANTFYANNTDALSLPPEAARRKSFPRDVITNQSYVSISYPLEPGTYIVQLTVHIPSVGVENADRKYIQIAAPDIIPYIAGGSARSHGWEDELVLNANKSRDPLSLSNGELIFEWFCKYAEDNAKFIDTSLGCFGNGKDQVEYEGPVFRLIPRSLFESLTYEFKVKVSSPDRVRTSSTLQAITVKPGSPPDARIRCIHNCGYKITHSERLVLAAECSNCSGVESLSYHWTLFNASKPIPQAIWPGRALTQQTSSNLVILGDTFEAGVTYILRITVTRAGGISGFSDYERTTNERPHGGRCDVIPTSGKELDTVFSVTCRDWQDEDLPLTYEILYSRREEGGGHELVAYGPGLENTTVIFPAGRKEFNHSLEIIIRVTDAYGTWTTITKDIQVFPHIVASEELLNMTVGHGSKLSKILGKGDVQGAVQLISVIANILNSDSSETTPEDGKQIRSSLADAFSRMRPLNLDDVRQISFATKTVTDVTSELSVDSQVKISNMFASMAQLVVQKAEENEDGGTIEHVCTAMLGGLANLIEASSLSSSERNREKTSSTGLKVVEALNDAMLLTKTPDENATVIKVKGLTVSLSKLSPNKMAGSTISADGGQISLPNAESLFRGVAQRDARFLTAAMTELISNPHSGSNSSARVKSSVLDLVLKGPEGKVVTVKDLTTPVDIFLPRRGDSEMKESLNKSRTPLSDGRMSIHRVTLPRDENSLQLDLTPEDRMSPLTVYLRYNEIPSETEHDLKTTLPQNSTQHQTSSAHHVQTRSIAWSSSVSGPYALFVPRDYLKGEGTYFIGVFPAGMEERPLNYTFQVHSSGCYYWNETFKEWTSDGCEVGEKTGRDLLHCRCSHLTWFGSDLFVPPNKLDIGESLDKLLELQEYPVLLATFCSIISLYLLCLIWAARKDKADLKKIGLVVVCDCDPADEYRYEVTVYTGRGKKAGTTANVSLVMSGEQDQTCAHTLNDDDTRPVLQAGGVDSFLLTTSGSLGSLTYIRIWHDNSGKNPSWYLNQVVVRDIETDEKFFFLCERWFACDEGDGHVDRLIPAAGKEELGDFVHLFRTKTTRDFSNNHLWFSVAFRPARSQFTRAQRVTCCLSLLMCTMLANVMWYNVPVKAENNVIIDAGFFTFTWHQFIVGIQSSLIVFPINLLLVQLFRKVAVSPKAKKVYLEKVTENTERQTTKDKDRTVSLSEITTSTSRQASAVSRIKNSLPSKKRKLCTGIAWDSGLEKTDSLDEELFNCLLQTQVNCNTASNDDRLKVTKKPKDEVNDESLEYLTTDDIYQLLYKNETQTDKELAENRLTSFGTEETPLNQPTYRVSIDSTLATDTLPLVQQTGKQAREKKKKKKKKKRQWCKFVLPWWFVFVSWFLCLATAAVAGFLTMLWGLSFTRSTQEEWLASLFVSIINDIFISQPLKVICFAIFFALVFKRPQEEEDDVINAELAQDEEWLQHNLAQKRGVTSKEPTAYHPPDQVMLQKARLVRFKEKKMHSVLREILLYFLFVWMVLLIAYGHRDPNAPLMTRSVEDIFVGKGYVSEHHRETVKRQKSRADDHRLLHVKNTREFWTWVDNVLIPGLYNNSWYNGEKFSATGFLSDRASIIIGAARLRQLRVKDDTCEVAKVIETSITQCHEPYSWEAEDRTLHHYPGWNPANQSLPDTTENSAWQYRTATELKGHPILGDMALYRGGGYVVELRSTADDTLQIVNELKSRDWVDENTRAVFVEFTIYNGNNNIYSVVNMLLEFTTTGGSFPFVQVLSTRIDRYIGNMKLFVLSCEVAFVLFTIFFTYQEVRRLFKSNIKVYLTELWTWIELSLIFLSWTVIVFYFIRMTLDHLVKKEIQANRDSFVNFHYLATTDQVYGYVYAFVVFFISIKILRLFRFNKRMSLLGSTIRASFKELSHFSIIFSLVFLSFAHLCYLVFSRELEKFSTFLSTLETLLSVMLGKFSYLNFEQTNRVLGPIMFFFYSVGVVFILMNMFLSIIIENFKAVKSQNDLQSNEHEIVSFMLDQFRAWLGLNSWNLFNGRVQDMPKPVYKKRKKIRKEDELKERVDRLVTLIKKVHFNIDEDGDFLRNDGEITYQVPSVNYESLA